MMKSAKQYHAYARECLNLAEEAEQPDVRKSLIELSRAWMQAALAEEKNHLNEIAPKITSVSSPNKNSKSASWRP
jgi:hypothetical protein